MRNQTGYGNIQVGDGLLQTGLLTDLTKVVSG